MSNTKPPARLDIKLASNEAILFDQLQTIERCEYKRIWKAVLLQALMDLSKAVHRGSNPKEDMIKTLKFFLKDTGELEYVCMNAEVCPIRYRAYGNELIKQYDTVDRVRLAS